jgi:hypothetical protein
MGGKHTTIEHAAQALDILHVHGALHAADVSRRIGTFPTANSRLALLERHSLAARQDNKLWTLTDAGTRWATRRSIVPGSPWCDNCQGAGWFAMTYTDDGEPLAPPPPGRATAARPTARFIAGTGLSFTAWGARHATARPPGRPIIRGSLKPPTPRTPRMKPLP